MKIELRNVSKSFGQKVIFSNYSEVVDSGAFCCIYGESGTGKSTLLNMIGFLEPYEGEIRYDDKLVFTQKEKRKLLAEAIGFLFQNFGLIENETVIENFQILKNFNVKISRLTAEQLLKKVGLENVLDRPIYELSGGEQQRVAIAKLLYKNPKLILADEPTASLDADNKKVVLDLLSKLNKQGTTIIVVTHDESIRDYANQIINL